MRRARKEAPLSTASAAADACGAVCEITPPSLPPFPRGARVKSSAAAEAAPATTLSHVFLSSCPRLVRKTEFDFRAPTALGMRQ